MSEDIACSLKLQYNHGPNILVKITTGCIRKVNDGYEVA